MEPCAGETLNNKMALRNFLFFAHSVSLYNSFGLQNAKLLAFFGYMFKMGFECQYKHIKIFCFGIRNKFN